MPIVAISQPPKWGNPIELERKRRIRVAVWAYAYEVKSQPMVDDATFDREIALIDPQVRTGHDVLDRFFRESFAAHTGQWIWQHPELQRVAALWQRVTEWRKAA